MAPGRPAPASGRGKGKGGKPELTEEQKQEIREAFDLFDTDGSGTHGGGARAEGGRRRSKKNWGGGRAAINPSSSGTALSSGRAV